MILKLVIGSTLLLSSFTWHDAGRVTWYGPGFYGNRTACGKTLTRSIIVVAHRRLPCGTRVRFRWHRKTHTIPVIDRGPYPSCCRRTYRFDWTAGTARLFGGTFTREGVKFYVVSRPGRNTIREQERVSLWLLSQKRRPI